MSSSTKDFTFDNQVAILPFKLRLVNSIENGIKQLSDDIKQSKEIDYSVRDDSNAQMYPQLSTVHKSVDH